MGWPSTLENAVDRATDALHMLREDSVGGVSQITEGEKLEAVTILDRFESSLTEARAYLEMATDPRIDLATNLAEARDEQQKSEARLNGYERSCIVLMSELNKERKKTNDLSKKVEELTRERNRLDRKIDQAMKSDSSAVAMYDMFPPRSSTPGGQKNAK